eukprot:228700-Amphidinium_carterae.1
MLHRIVHDSYSLSDAPIGNETMALCFRTTKAWLERNSVRCSNGYVDSFRTDNFEFGEMSIKGALHLSGEDLKTVMGTIAWSTDITQKYVSHFESLFDVTVLESVSMASLEMAELILTNESGKVSATLANHAPKLYAKLQTLRDTVMTSTESSVRKLEETQEFYPDGSVKKLLQRGFEDLIQICHWQSGCATQQSDTTIFVV